MTYHEKQHMNHLFLFVQLIAVQIVIRTVTGSGYETKGAVMSLNHKQFSALS
jgi:hypothetical protein